MSQDATEIAVECGYIIEQGPTRIVFYNLHLLRYRHLAWFFGVIAGIFLLTVIFVIYLGHVEGAFDWGMLTGATVMLLISAAVFARALIKHQQRKTHQVASAHIAHVADLAAGLFLDAKNRPICRVDDIAVRTKGALDTYLTGDDGPYYEKVVFKYGWCRSVCVFKSENEHTAKRIADHLKDALSTSPSDHPSDS